VERGRRDRRACHDDRQVLHTRVPGPLQALEVEREGPVERRTAEEERGRDPEAPEDRRGDEHMAREVVVERDRHGEALAAAPCRHRLEESIGRHDVVVADDMPQLALEEPSLVRWNELARRIARTPIHAVVHQRHARLATRQPEEKHERDAHGDANDPRNGAHDALRERGMRKHVGHGEAAEVSRPQLVAGFGPLEGEWDALAERSGSIFATALWSRIWWQHHGGDRELLLHATRSADGSLAVVLPLYAWRGRLPRVIRFLGHGPGDELGPVYARGEHDAAARALRSALDGLDWDVFFGEQLPGDEPWPELLAGRTWRREACPSLRLPGSWDEYLAGRSSNFREQLRRRQAGLEREGTVVTRLADERTLDRDLDALFSLHRSRWGATPTDFGDTPFHRELAGEALGRGWLRLRLLELDGRPVAAWHGFQVGATCSYYQAGRDPAFDRHSVGFVLMAHSIRSAIAEGAREYSFGRGDEAFKSRFATHDPGLETVVLTRGLIGACAHVLVRAARTSRHRLGLSLRSA
jgi:CelD/BcsL family acetyltransferase involved in cellulose biosynthesis